MALAQQSEKAKQDAEAAARRNAEGLKQGHRVSDRLGELKVEYIHATKRFLFFLHVQGETSAW